MLMKEVHQQADIFYYIEIIKHLTKEQDDDTSFLNGIHISFPLQSPDSNPTELSHFFQTHKNELDINNQHDK